MPTPNYKSPFKLNDVGEGATFTNIITGDELVLVRHIDEGCALVRRPSGGSFYLDGHTPVEIRGCY